MEESASLIPPSFGEKQFKVVSGPVDVVHSRKSSGYSLFLAGGEGAWKQQNVGGTKAQSMPLMEYRAHPAGHLTG
jgi:hypothetical protein